MKKLSLTDELKRALRKRVLAGDFFLVTGGDGRGVIVEKAPRPRERLPAKPTRR